MHNLDLVNEAADCRKLAKHLRADPVHGFLLKLATAFEQLAQSKKAQNNPVRALPPAFRIAGRR